MRRRRVIVGLTVLALIVAVAAFALSRPPLIGDRVRQIQPGMTLAEVSAELGAPPGDHTRHVSYVSHGLQRSDSPVKEWDWDEGCVFVQFGPDGRVQDVTYYPNAHPPTVWDRMRYWLPW